jgi:hypothetical protein
MVDKGVGVCAVIIRMRMFKEEGGRNIRFLPWARLQRIFTRASAEARGRHNDSRFAACECGQTVALEKDKCFI